MRRVKEKKEDGERVCVCCLPHVNERGVEDDVSAVVEDIDDRFADPGEAFDGLLNGSGAGGTSHSDDGEKSGGL